MKSSTRSTLIVLAFVMLPAVVGLQSRIDPMRKLFQPGKEVSVTKDVNNNPVMLPTQFIVGTAIGFREVVAGLLWIRTDGFFHSGKFEAMVPLFRMITWLDPHQLDVYSTGSWHMAYNFTDSSERADHRYLRPAIAFLTEGIENNEDVWDLKSSMGFTIHYLKTLDYAAAVRWQKAAAKDPTCKLYVHHLIAHSYERLGRIDDAIAQWKRCIEIEKAALAKSPNTLEIQRDLDVSQKNLDAMYIRRAKRASLSKHQTDVNFEATFIRIKPRVFIIAGRANVPDGARIDLRLDDAVKSKDADVQSGLGVDQDATEVYDIGMHGISVRNGRFMNKYNLTRDPKQYPFKQDKYVLTVSFNPRTSTIGAQDKFGWNGEGLTDRRYLDTSVPGLRMVKKTFVLKRSDIL